MRASPWRGHSLAPCVQILKVIIFIPTNHIINIVKCVNGLKSATASFSKSNIPFALLSVFCVFYMHNLEIISLFCYFDLMIDADLATVCKLSDVLQCNRYMH